ncbi:MAG: TAXI family TRAP transporter solute-binding subunit [Desulfovibrio sp.]|nr:TAXI family TRAP transporter solute-binding subunit [Desulfovibrio sp.]
MKNCRRILSGVLVLLSFFVWTNPALCADAAAPTHKHLRILTGPVGGQWHTMGEPLASALSQIIPVSSRSGGGLTNIQAIDKKNADIAFTLACFLGAGQSGEAEYKSLKTDNVALLASVYPQVLYFLIRKDFAVKHNITSVGSLLDKKMPLRFATLKPGTASEFIVSMLLKYGYGTDYDKLRLQGWNIAFNNYSEMADDFTEGNLDCFAYTAGTTVPLIHAMENVTEVAILSVEQKTLKTLHDKFRTGTHTIQPGDYKGITTPVMTLGDYTTLIISKSLPDSLAYQIAESLWGNRGMVSKLVKDFDALSPKTAMPEGLETHPGAAKFWNELLQGKNKK